MANGSGALSSKIDGQLSFLRVSASLASNLLVDHSQVFGNSFAHSLYKQIQVP